jgi:hypothetical protein
MANTAAFRVLIKPLQQSDPRLYDALNKLATDIERLNITVFPPTLIVTGDQTSIPVPVPDVTDFNYELKSDSVRLYWSPPASAVLRYEIRQGTVWETANSILTTDTLSAELEPLAVGTTSFLIKAIGEDGTESTNARLLNVIVPPLGNISINAQVIDNTVLLFWSPPTSTFRIAYYEVRKDGVLIGTLTGTFSTIFESVSGTYTYSVQAFDIRDVPNSSPLSSTSATVNQPPDYELQANFTSSLTGTLTRVTKIPGPRLLCCTRVETWQQHFSDRGWNNIQDQLNAGYPLYIHPSEATGQYEEVIDYGLVISSTVITVSYNTALVYGTGVTVRHFISTSLDNITYGTEVETLSMFVASLRYAKIRVTFTAID